MDWSLIIITFFITFVAELGDKTQLAVFSLVSEHGKPLPVFLGASLALIAVSGIGAFFGKTLADRIPSNYLQMTAGLMFICLGIFMLFRFFKSVQGG